ncbi:uncharacterized protein LOC111085509 [Limulus polyphemus]|uniref:Uncharacterized protein LOC111085509 n=1 Tax=Limulus polyphemus TaxID=6850 RepID=A0ABM1S918_LIMPO|nr:uncharacterized protein LOC111085509 [Limulus polyphemus]
MCSAKTTGELTRGRVMTEMQHLFWILLNPACAEINNTMQEFTSVTYSTGDQHKDLMSTRLQKDMIGTQDHLSYLVQRNSFSSEPTLINIATCVTVSSSVNAYDVKVVGQSILTSMEGKVVTDYTFRKKTQAVKMDVKTCVKIRDEEVHVDPQLLFQRLITAGIRCSDLSEIFEYELCTYTSAVFESRYVIRPANKSTL